jgi:hypothetical protein
MGFNVVGLFEESLAFLDRSSNGADGLLLVIDELGKFLEYGASHPDQGDVFVLQGLAEAAARAERPFLVLPVLHQSLGRYAEHVSPRRRAEWAKVQGRFEDIAFEEHRAGRGPDHPEKGPTLLASTPVAWLYSPKEPSQEQP